jgi:hypothetical protein
MATVRRKRGYTRIQPGDELHVEAAGDGRVIMTREEDPVDALAALGEKLDIRYPPGYLEHLRAEWA